VQRFRFVASKFTDVELPILYAFGYIVDNGADLVLQSPSESTSATTLLPAGSADNDHKLICTVRAYNNVGASRLVSSSVVSTPAKLDIAELGSIIESSVMYGTAETSTDHMRQTVSWGVSTINSHNCTIDCSSWNRNTCVHANDICGTCKDSFAGEVGPGNTLCYPENDNSGVVNVEFSAPVMSVSGECISSVECELFYDCISESCVRPEKSCPSDCSGHGTCFKSHIHRRAAVSSCLVGDPLCKVMCICDSGYGGLSCALPDDDIFEKMKTRTTLISALEYVADQEGVSDRTTPYFLDVLYLLGGNSNELTELGCDILRRVIDILLLNIGDIDISFDILLNIPAVLSNCLVVYESNSTADNENQITNTTALIRQWGLLISSDLVFGQEFVEVIESSYRQRIGVVSATKIGDIMTSSAASNIERFVDLNPSTVTVNKSISLDEDLHITVSEYSSSLYENGTTMASNPISLYISDQASIADVVYFNLSTFSDVNFGVDRNHNFSHTWQCDIGQKGVVFNYTCPDSANIMHQCTGRKYNITIRCPLVTTLPTCAVVINGKINANSFCELHSFAPSYAVCECFLTSGRRLVSDLFTADTSVEVVAISEYLGKDFYETIVYADDLTVKDLNDSIAVILMFAAMWLLVQFAVIAVSAVDNHSINPQDAVTTTTAPVPHRASRMKKKSTGDSESPASLRKYLLHHFDGVFPLIFRPEGNTWKSFFDEIRKHHRYILMFAARGPDSDSVRIRVAIQMLTVQSMLMFIMAIFYDIQYPNDDGTCATYKSRSSCLHERSIFNRDETICEWNESSSGYTCEYKTVRLTTETAVIVGTLMAIFTAPVNFVIDFLFDQILSAPTADDEKALKAMSDTSNHANERIRRVITKTFSSISGVPRMVSSFTLFSMKEKLVVDETRKVSVALVHSHAMTSMVLRKSREQSQHRLSVSSNLDSDVETRISTVSNKLPCGVTKKSSDTYSEFMSLLSRQCHVLNGESRRRFCSSWLVDRETGEVRVFTRPRSLCGERHISITAFIQNEIISVDRIAKAKIEKLKYASDIHVGLELCHLFVSDFLGRTTPEAKIYEYKTEEEFKHSFVVTKFAKGATWFIVFLINMFFILFTLLRASHRDKFWQYSYITACAIQMVIEVCLYETMECVWINYSVPSLVVYMVLVNV